MDPLRLTIACVPVAAYLLLLGIVNLRRKPLLTTGACDLAAMGIALSGFVFVGPIELFRPEAATAELGNWMWLFLLAFYWLWIALATLISRPRLVIYNMTAEQLRPMLADAVGQVDTTARWAGDNLVLPQLGAQLHIDVFTPMRHASLVSSGAEQNLDGWRRLRKALSRSLQSVPVAPNPRGFTFVLAATLLIAACLAQTWSHPQEVAQAMGEIFAF